MSQVRRLSRIELISADPPRLSAFYEALGFTGAHSSRRDAHGETRMALRLVGERIDLVKPARVGAPYPPFVPGWSPRFQHFAIVVSDMRAAYARLQTLTGWTAISTDGPQRLPETSGGATAFKFRDPEGHPLELIAFSPARTPDRWRLDELGDLLLGIDHTALSVANTEHSIDFYQKLGLAVASRSLNVGVEQARLDDLPQPHVEVTALTTANHPTPHLELLCYVGDYARDTRPMSEDDVGASRSVFEVASHGPPGAGPSMMRDPDGHLLVVERIDPYSGST